MEYVWTCSCCGKPQNELPLDWHAKAPAGFPPEGHSLFTRSELGDNYCRVAEQEYVRGLVTLPIRGTEHALVWSVWVSLSAASMEKLRDALDQDVFPEQGFFGWFCNSLPPYPESLNLKTDVLFRTASELPSIVIQDLEHPLGIEQRNGITMARAVEIAEMLLPHH